MIGKNKGKSLPSLAEKIWRSSATVQRNVLYNIGGLGSNNSVCWLDLLCVKTRWKSLKTLGLTDFSEERFKNAIVVKKKIVYFGSNMRRATYVMEQENKEQGN